MSTVSPSAADAVERVLRAAGRHLRELDAASTTVPPRASPPVPAPRAPVEEAVACDEDDAAAALAMALESRHLRERATRFVTEIEEGNRVAVTDVRAIVRAFRSYRPFLRDRDRERNDVVHRRLVQAVRVHSGTAAA